MKINSYVALMVTFLITSSLKPIEEKESGSECYDPKYVEISTVKFKDDIYSLVLLRRDGNRVKAKYFSRSGEKGDDVVTRYNNWRQSVNNQIILTLSGAGYKNSYEVPQGLTIENGIPVNNNLVHGRMDGLVIVYATGGITISNLKNGDLFLSGGGVEPSRKFNLAQSSIDVQDFMDWAKSQEATVFQTHLLVYKNALTISPNNSDPTHRTRRFLAIGKDENKKIVHIIIDYPQWVSLYDGARNVRGFLNDFKDIEVHAMVNLDPGIQDIITLYNNDCSVNTTIKGAQPIETAVNLLTYYFQ